MDDIEQNIRRAYDAAKRSGISEPDLLLEAFRYALSYTSTTPPLRSQSAVAEPQADERSGYEKIAATLRVPLEVVELLYDIRGATISLNLPDKALPNSVSAAMRDIAVLLAVGYKHAGVAEGVDFEHIRHVCGEYGKLDKRNFAAAMSGMKPRLVVNGKGTDRELIPKRPADDMARDLILRYAQSIQ